MTAALERANCKWSYGQQFAGSPRDVVMGYGNEGEKAMAEMSLGGSDMCRAAQSECEEAAE